MASNSASNDVERALNSIRSRADHLRRTISNLEQCLAWRPDMTWPKFLGQYMVIAKQLENMNDEIPEMIQHFACVPRMSTPNPADIPMLLRTREDPEMEEDDRKLMANKQNLTWETLSKMIDSHNEVAESLEETFREMSDGLLKSIRMNKYVTKTKPISTQSEQFKYMESGSFE